MITKFALESLTIKYGLNVLFEVAFSGSFVVTMCARISLRIMNSCNYSFMLSCVFKALFNLLDFFQILKILSLFPNTELNTEPYGAKHGAIWGRLRVSSVLNLQGETELSSV